MTQLSLTGLYNDGSGAAALPEAQRYQPELSNAQMPSQESVAWNISGPKDYTEQIYRKQSGGYGGFLRGGDNPLDIEAQKKKEDDMDFMQWAAEEAQKAYEQAYKDFMDTYSGAMTFYDTEGTAIQEDIDRLTPQVEEIEATTEVINSPDGRTICKDGDKYVFVNEKGRFDGEVEDPALIAYAEEQEQQILAEGKTLRAGEQQFTVSHLKDAKDLQVLLWNGEIEAADIYNDLKDGKYKDDPEALSQANEQVSARVDSAKEQLDDYKEAEYHTKMEKVEAAPRHAPVATITLD